MQVLVGLVVLIGASQGQQAVSYQNFRASHGQGHPTYRADGSWSQSFGGGHRSFGSGLRGGRFFSPPPAFPPLQASFRPVIAYDQGFPNRPLYDVPPTSAFLSVSPSPFPDPPPPSFAPDPVPQQVGTPQTFGDDRLPSYSADSVGPAYNSDVSLRPADPGPTSSPQFESPTAQPLESRGGGTEYRPEAQTPQASFHGPAPGTILSQDPQNSPRSSSYQTQSSGSYNSNYNSFDHPPNPSPTPNSPREFSNYNGRGPPSDYSPINSSPTPSSFVQNDRGPTSSYSPSPRGPSPDLPHSPRGSPDYDHRPSSDFPPSRGPSANYSPNARGPSTDFVTSSRGPTSDYSAIEGGPSYSPQGRGPSPTYGPEGRGPSADYNSPGRGPHSNLAPNGRGPSGDYRADIRGYNGGEGRPVYDRRGPGGGFGKPHSPLQSTGPHTYASQNKLPHGHGKPLAPPPSNYKPLHPEHRGNSRQSAPPSKRPNFSGEEGGQSFESDFQSSELGGQSFEVPDFPSDEAYFNSQEGYGSFEGKSFNSEEGGAARKSGSYENSGEKGFVERDSSYESDERAQSAERAEVAPRGGPGFSPIEKSVDLSDKKTFHPEVKPDSSPAGEPKPYPGTSYPEKRADPLRRNPSALESRAPLQGRLPYRPPTPGPRIYKRKPAGEKVASFDEKDDDVPVKKKVTKNKSD